jgi:hypothetical protein
MDTYANLLYKNGYNKEAISIEERACAVSNNNKELLANLEKMKSGQPTWAMD